MEKIKTLNVVKKTGINQYYMDDNRAYMVSAHGDMQAKVRLRLCGSRKSYEVINYDLDENFNLTSATIIYED